MLTLTAPFATIGVPFEYVASAPVETHKAPSLALGSPLDQTTSTGSQSPDKSTPF